MDFPDLRAEMEAWLTEPPDNVEVPPDDLSDADRRLHADRLLRRIAAAERELKAIADVTGPEFARLTAFVEDRAAGPRRIIVEALAALEGFMRAERERIGPRFSSLTLPHGTLRLNATRASLVVADETMAVAALKTAGLDELVEESVAKAPLKKLVLPGPPDGLAPYKPGEPIKTRAKAVLSDGTILDGVFIEEPTERSFTYQSAAADIPAW